MKVGRSLVVHASNFGLQMPPFKAVSMPPTLD
jgi:hypothetical protein